MHRLIRPVRDSRCRDRKRNPLYFAAVRGAGPGGESPLTENEPSSVRNEVKLLEAFVWQRKFRDEEESARFQGDLSTPLRSGRGDRDAVGHTRRIKSGSRMMFRLTPQENLSDETALGKI